MKRLILIVVLLTQSSAVVAQVETYLSSLRPPTQISMMGIYQRYTDDASISQFSLPLGVLVPLSNGIGLSFQTSPAAAGGDRLESIEGLSDARLAVSYYGRMGPSSLIASLTANLPSGQTALTNEEFGTSVLISQNFYDFRVPIFGQGFNVTPGITWATPLSETVVLGLGVAYQVRGTFEPLSDGARYDPGDEVILTGGLDVAIDDAWTLSGDASFTRYGTDRIEEVDRYRSGSKFALTGQLARRYGENHLRLLARYRTRGKGEIPIAGELVAEEERIVPDHILLHAGFRIRTAGRSNIAMFGQGRLFSETLAYPAVNVVDLGVTPEYVLSSQWRLVSRFIYTFGDFSGFEGGVGFSASI